jgi:predicted amidophosphoribosyltransferase
MSAPGWEFVRRIVSVDEIVERVWCDRIEALGSFWVDDPPRDVASQLAKFLKEGAARPPWPAVATAYAELAGERLAGVDLDGITRVISADETEADRNHPLERLSRMLADRLQLPRPLHFIRRRTARLPMRNVDRLRGYDRLRDRVDFVLTDLQVRRAGGPRRILLVDDILCLGASMRVYGAALKTACGAERVIGINIAATRFRGGDDGWDELRLDLDRFLEIARGVRGVGGDAFDDVWVSTADRTYHADPRCRLHIPAGDYRSLRFLAAGRNMPCSGCARREPAPWWRLRGVRRREG